VKIILADKARQLGLKKYFTGRACPNGHTAERLVSNGNCTACMNAAMRKHRAKPENREKERIRAKEYNRRIRSDPARAALWKEKDRINRSKPNGKRAQRQYTLKTQMNANIELVEMTFAAQGYKCRICKTDLKDAKWGKKVCDHDHKTGQFRAVLCCKCNAGLGYFNEDLDLVKSVIDYLTVFHDQLRRAG
jgi:hypothetical protein